MSLKLNVIIGSTRPGRVGAPIGQWLKEFSTEHGKFDVELVDLADFNLPLLDEAAHPVFQQYEHEHQAVERERRIRRRLCVRHPGV